MSNLSRPRRLVVHARRFSSEHRARGRMPARAAAALTLITGLSACELPTAAPILETRWILPVETTSIAVDEFLPQGIVVSDGAFDVAVDPFSSLNSLADFCPGCQAFNGLVVPKPAFQVSVEASSTLGPDIESAELASAVVALELFNGFGFDPLRPSATATGTLTVTLIDGGAGGRVLDQVILDGATVSMPPSSTTTLVRALAPGSVSALTAVVELNSPAGDPVQIDTSDRFDLVFTVEALSIASARVDVSGRELTIDATTLQTDGIDDTVIDRLLSGALDLEIENPFGVAMALSFEIRGPGFAPIVRSLDISDAAESSARLEYDAAELRSFLGRPDIVFAGIGTVNPAAAMATLRPGQELVIDASLDAVLELGR